MHFTNSNSVGQISRFLPWLRENYAFFQMRIKGLNGMEAEFLNLLSEIEEYANRYVTRTGFQLKNARMLEIGYGARPNRLIAMDSLGYNVIGIDLDRPVLTGTATEFMEIYRKNGGKRMLKSLIRNKLFDNLERSALRRALSTRGVQLRIDPVKFLVGDASTFNFPRNSFDFIYSEDVFEHIPADSLEQLCKNLTFALSDNGVALITPDIYTGIAGGHIVEWYAHTLELDMQRKTAPWGHLRKNVVHADCYLNKMRVDDYKKIFSKYFNVTQVINRNPGMGRRYLTDDIRKELSAYSEEELLSNKWTFVLTKSSC